jgi:hypothetical protein
MKKNAIDLARKSYVETHWGSSGEMTDQKLRCADPEEVMVVLGQLDSIVYDTAKGRFSPSELWEHEFGSPRPVLCYSPTSRLLLIAGGRYTVTNRGIEG